MLVGELGRHLVLAGRCRQVRDVDRAVLVVLAANLGLARPLDGERQTARTRAPGRDTEVGRVTAHAVDEAEEVE